jgi:hypothetical protein
MSSHPYRYNRIYDARIIHSIFHEGLSYANTSECYGYPYETIKSIAKVFEEKYQSVPKPKGDVCYPILQDVNIQWLVERLHVDPHITVESLHRWLNEVFQFPRAISIYCVSTASPSQNRLLLKFMRYESNYYNSEEHLREHKK